LQDNKPLIQDLEKKELSPYLVTGFADAESYFVPRITKTTRKLGWSIKLLFGIELHIKDLSLLKDIQSFFGVGSIILRVREGRNTAIYSVQSLKDLNNVIIPHFSKYPLLTQKRVDFYLFSTIVNLMNRKEHLDINGILKIVSIKASMNKGLSENLKKIFPNAPYSERPIMQNIDSIDPYWLTGFVDGEGCFYVKTGKSIKGKPQVLLVFSISQHIRDILLFNKMKEYMGCGLIEKIRTRPNAINFVVYKFTDQLGKIIPFFNKYNLKGTKQLDHRDFLKVALLMKEKAHLTEEGMSKICQIKSGMNRGR
jgi:LAGLIDADG endonuclease